MRSGTPTPLAWRRARLLERSATLRGALVREASTWQRPLAAADSALATLCWLHAQRWWLLGAALMVLAARPRRGLRWARRGWWLWRLSRRLRPWVSALSPRHPAAAAPPTAAPDWR